MAGREWRAHIVLIPFFSASHSIPFFDFATRLASSAVKVTILSAEYHVQKVWSDALYWNWAPRLRAQDSIELVAVRDGIYDGTWEGFSKVVNDEASQAQLVAAFRVILEPLMAMSPVPCCIVSDMFVGWAQDLADQFDIPRFLLHIQPASHLSLMLHVPELVAEGRLPLTEENGTEPMAIPGFKNAVHPSDLVVELRDVEVIKKGGYDTFLRMGRQARQAPLVLVNTFRELEEDVFLSFDLLRSTDPQFPKVIPIGPVLLPHDYPSLGIGGEMSKENRSLMQWLDLQPPRSVLYIAFGTLVRNGEERVKEIALALEASQQPFLWAAGTAIKRPNEPPPPHVSELLPPGFEERTQKQGKVVTMVVPQIHILRHPACGAFLSHCGWNSVLESITSGVPLIAWPQQYEQFMTARYLIDTANVAAELVEVRRGFVAREEIQRVVRLVMHETEEGAVLRLRAAELKQFAACYVYSNPNLDTFLAEMAQMSRP